MAEGDVEGELEALVDGLVDTDAEGLVDGVADGEVEETTVPPEAGLRSSHR